MSGDNPKLEKYIHRFSPEVQDAEDADVLRALLPAFTLVIKNMKTTNCHPLTIEELSNQKSELEKDLKKLEAEKKANLNLNELEKLDQQEPKPEILAELTPEKVS